MIWFEQESGLSLTLHDLSHRLWRQLPLTRVRHAHPACERVKKGAYGDRCLAFEISAFREQAAEWKQGRLHRCHAGLVELALPVFVQEQLLLVLFAGPARLKQPQLLDWREERSPAAARAEQGLELPELDAAELPRRWEQLQQLAARLRCWLQDHEEKLPEADAPRARQIQKYLEDHYAEPVRLKDVAEILSLSPERCRHVIRESCGQSFSSLLMQTRLRAACALLANSDLPISEIAQLSGIPDPSTFTRSFRKQHQCSPRDWRKLHGG